MTIAGTQNFARYVHTHSNLNAEIVLTLCYFCAFRQVKQSRTCSQQQTSALVRMTAPAITAGITAQCRLMAMVNSIWLSIGPTQFGLCSYNAKSIFCLVAERELE